MDDPNEPENTYAVQIVGSSAAQAKMKEPVFYVIEVTGPGIYHEIDRRFSQFLRLDRKIRSKFPHLPPMPPRSAIMKRILPKFMRTRQEALSRLLEAAVAADPNLSDMDLRSFLGVDYFETDTTLSRCVSDDDTFIGRGSASAEPSPR